MYSSIAKVLGIILLCWNVLGITSGQSTDDHLKLSLHQHYTGEFREDNKSLTRCQNSYRGLTTEETSRYIDASGRPGSGIYGGNALWFGSFSECKKMSKARYCLTMFNAFVDLGQNQSKAIFPLQWGVCTPDTCSKENVADGIEFLLKNISMLPVQLFHSNTSKKEVHCAESPDYTTGVVLTIVFFGILVGLCIFATILDIIMNAYNTSDKLTKEKSGDFSMDKVSNERTPLLSQEPPLEETTNSSKSLLFETINCFSVVRNSSFILNTNVGKSDLIYLHGIRVISLFWIILLHMEMDIYFSFMPTIFPADNPKDMNRYFRRSSYSVIVNGAMAVDTFFVLSGLLVIYTNMNKMDKNGGKINWIRFYFHRFWRLTPSYMFAILFLTKLRPFFGDGPHWYIAADTSRCSDYWWTNLLYINNFHPKNLFESCIVQTWYLANDMQFFVISPIFILIALRYGFKPFLAFASFIVLASVITTASIFADKNCTPVYGGTREEFESLLQYSKYIYTKPYCRIPSYIIGMVLGYVVYKHMGRKLRINWFWAVFIWCVAIGTALSIVYAPHNALKSDPHVWSKGEKVIYGSLRWVLWSMCVSWLILACQYGYAGLAKDILGAKFWIPLSRINYAAFILHIDVILVLGSNIEAPLHITVFTMVNFYLATLVLSYACAFLWTVVVELPFANLESLLTRKRKK